MCSPFTGGYNNLFRSTFKIIPLLWRVCTDRYRLTHVCLSAMLLITNRLYKGQNSNITQRQQTYCPQNNVLVTLLKIFPKILTLQVERCWKSCRPINNIYTYMDMEQKTGGLYISTWYTQAFLKSEIGCLIWMMTV